MKRPRWGLALLAAAGAAALVSAAPHRAWARSAGKTRSPQVRFTDYKLPNGLRVLLSADHSAPVVAVSVTYNVGSRDERLGRTGFAHLFEHMMFQGSENVGKGEHPRMVGDNGGTMNGTTSQDRTNYFEAVPANQLEMGLFLEADRMRALDISQVNLDNQRAVVQEEKRQSYDNRPYGHMFEQVLDLAYSSFAYKHTTIGSMKDLDAATLDDVRQFFKTYYAPNNAVLAVVGDFEIGKAKELVKKYFGTIPRQPAPPAVTFTEPPPTQEQRRTITDALAPLPRYVAAYKTVPGDQKDFYALTLLADILGQGRTSRLYTALVEKQLATSIGVDEDESRGPGLFFFSADVPPGGKVATIEQILDAELQKVQSEGIKPEELARAKTQARVSAVNRLQTALGRANQLSLYAVFFNDPNRINSLLPKLEAVSAEDVQRVARKYLVRENRVVLIVQPAKGTETAAR